MSCENCEKHAYQIVDLKDEINDLRAQLRAQANATRDAAHTASKALERLLDYGALLAVANAWRAADLIGRGTPALHDLADVIDALAKAEEKRKAVAS